MAKSSEKTDVSELQGLSALEQNRIVRMPEAARLSGLSKDSLKRNHRDKIIQLGPRAVGMRVRDVLQLSKATRTSA